MPNPIVLPAIGTPLYRQVLAYLATDTDPTQGLLAALGQGVNSLYPNYTTDGPSADRSLCPTPFVLVVPGGKRVVDRTGRDEKIVFEVHDDEDQGEQRYPGIVNRLITLISALQWRPTSDAGHTYVGGLVFDEESPPFLPDQRFGTRQVQLIFSCRVIDKTSQRGYNG